MTKTLELATRSSVELLPFGTRIAYHHRCAIARYKQHPWRESYKDDRPKGWLLTNVRWNEHVPLKYSMDSLKDWFFDWPQAKFSMFGSNHFRPVNKTVMVWPEDGYGWIIGVVKRGIGVSQTGYRSRDDYEPGYFTADMYVDLYVVKHMYEGINYILCPLWAVSPVEE